MYTSTFSKMVSPGMRIGWITANPDFTGHMIEAKNNISICNDGPQPVCRRGTLQEGRRREADPQSDEGLQEEEGT